MKYASVSNTYSIFSSSQVTWLMIWTQ